MTWIKSKPGKPPPAPHRVDLQRIMVQANERANAGTPAGKALDYLKANAPTQDLDKWGQPIPLCASDQDALDRLFAVLAFPARVRQLMLAGMLLPSEVDALKAVHPQAWADMVAGCVREMLASPPPYPAWSETMLGVLFQVPPEKMLADHTAGQDKQVDSAAEAHGNGPANAAGASADGTVADRREIAVRHP